MYLSNGNPNQIAFTFDKIIPVTSTTANPIGSQISSLSLDDISLGRFILVPDSATGIAHICMCVWESNNKIAKMIGVVPNIDANLSSFITNANLSLDIDENDESGDEKSKQLILRTEITYQTQYWAIDEETQIGSYVQGDTHTVTDETPVRIAFADNEYVMFTAQDDDESNIDGAKFTLQVKLADTAKNYDTTTTEEGSINVAFHNVEEKFKDIEDGNIIAGEAKDYNASEGTIKTTFDHVKSEIHNIKDGSTEVHTAKNYSDDGEIAQKFATIEQSIKTEVNKITSGDTKAKIAKDYDTKEGTIKQTFDDINNRFETDKQTAKKATVAKNYDTTTTEEGSINLAFQAIEEVFKDLEDGNTSVGEAKTAKDYDKNSGTIKDAIESIDNRFESDKQTVKKATTAKNYESDGTIAVSFDDVYDIFRKISEGILTVGVAADYAESGNIQTSFDEVNEKIDNIKQTTVSISQTQQSGNKIADITIDGNKTDLYSPKATVTQVQKDGTHIATIDGTDIYAPVSSGGGEGGIDEGELKKYLEDHKYIDEEALEGKDYITSEQLNNTLESKDYVTDEDLDYKGFVTQDYLSNQHYLTIEHAQQTYVPKAEVYGTLEFIGFNEYNTYNTKKLEVAIQSVENSSSRRYVSGDSSVTIDNMPYGRYYIGRWDSSTQTFDTEFPYIETAVGYGTKEIIDVSEWASYNFNSNTWEWIERIARKGLAKDYWPVGSIHDVKIGNDTYYLQIIGHGQDRCSEGYDNSIENIITLQLGWNTNDIPENHPGKQNLYNKLFSIGGSAAVDFWTDPNNTYKTIKNELNSIAEELKKNKVPLKKCSKICYRSSGDFDQLDEEISLLSESELFGTTKYSYGSEGEQYSFFTANRSSFIKYVRDFENTYRSNGYRILLRTAALTSDRTLNSLSTYNPDKSNIGYGPFTSTKSCALNPIVYI